MSKVWKGMLKDDVKLNTLGVKEGSQIMLMGSAETITAPVEKSVSYYINLFF